MTKYHILIIFYNVKYVIVKEKTNQPFECKFCGTTYAIYIWRHPKNTKKYALIEYRNEGEKAPRKEDVVERNMIFRWKSNTIDVIEIN